MSNLSFIPATPASKPTLDFQSTSLPEKKTEFGINSFDQFLKTANERQFKTDSVQKRLKKSHSSDVSNAKPEPQKDKDEFKTAEPSPAEKVASQSDQNQKVDTDSETKEASGAQYENTEKKVAAENSDEAEQKVEVLENANQEEILALLAYLTEAEAVIRGETQAETIQTVEFNQVMASAEGVANVQVISISDGNKLKGANPVETGSEIPVIKATEANAVKSDTGIWTVENVENLVNLNQIQVLSEGSGNYAPSEEESFGNQGQNPNAKGQISELVKVNANQKNGNESLTFDRIVFTDSQKVKVDSQLGGDLIIASHGQSFEKGGKVDLALVQTQLAVNDGPEFKAEIPAVNVIPGQPVFSNVSQIQASGSTEVISTNREELFSQIVEQAKVMTNNGGSEMEVNLKPEHLGRLQLKVTIENEVVTAKFVAESQQVKEIIESNLSQLRRSLQENGMQVDMIMVSVGYQQSNESFDQAAYNREGLQDFGGEMGQANDGRETKVEEKNSPVEHDGLIDLIA